MYRSIILGLIGAVVLLLAMEGVYSAAVFFGAFGLLFLVAPKLSRPQKGIGTQSDSPNEKQKPRTRWLLVIGIILLLSAFGWAPKLLSISGLKPSPLSEADNQNQSNTDKPRKSQRHVETVGGFSFIPPDGWEMQSIPKSKFKAAFGPPTGGFSPNIIVLDEIWPGSLDDYTKAGIELMPQKHPNIKTLKKGDFTTSEGLRGVRITLENVEKDTTHRQAIYVFARGESKLIVTCTTVAEGADVLDAVFEDSMKTFRIEEQKNIGE